MTTLGRQRPVGPLSRMRICGTSRTFNTNKNGSRRSRISLIFNGYAFLRLATPIKLIRPEPNNQTVARTVTTLALARIIDASSVHYKLHCQNHSFRILPEYLQRYHQPHRTLLLPYLGKNQGWQE